MTSSLFFRLKKSGKNDARQTGQNMIKLFFSDLEIADVPVSVFRFQCRPVR